MNRFDIYDAQIEWGGCTDRRPWLIVETPANNRVGCFPISGQSYRGTPFAISDKDPDFPATGLKKTCFVHDERITEFSVEVLIKRRGRLENDLLKRFRAHSGI
jgi:mRNA-degrading endonuclease toxin of MazEF toxin-antitoxin module